MDPLASAEKDSQLRKTSLTPITGATSFRIAMLANKQHRAYRPKETELTGQLLNLLILTLKRRESLACGNKTKSSKRKYRKGFIEQNLNKSKNSYATSKITNVIAKSYRKRSKDAPPGSKRDEKIINNLSKVLHSTQMRMRQNKDKKSLQSLISLQRKRQMENSLQSSQNG